MIKILKNLLIIITIGLNLNGCGSGSSSSNSSNNNPSKNNSTLNLHISSASNTNNNSLKNKYINFKDDISIIESNSSSIVSGMPEEMTIYIKSIKLDSQDDEIGEVSIFEDKNGKPVKINNGKVDISSLFQANIESKECFYSDNEFIIYNDIEAIVLNENNGTVIIKSYHIGDNNETIFDDTITEANCSVTDSQSISIPEGVYDSIRIEYFRRAKIKGCVDGVFEPYGTKDGIAGYHKYCTKYGKSTFEGINTQNSDFESNISQLMDIDLLVTNEGVTTDRTKTFDILYDIKGDIELKKGSTNDLTILFDLNRMLRYFNDGRIDNQPVNPNSPVDMTYFFTMDIRDVSYAFIGKVGKIYGYKMTLEGCTIEDAPDNGTHICPDNIDKNIVSLWMTSIYDQDNNHISTNFMPDDDDAWTVIKGSTNDIANPIIKNPDGTFNIIYTLGEGSNGTIYHFKHPNSVGSIVNGVTFTGFQNSYGRVYVIRKL